MDYKTLYNESITNKEEFWKKQAERIVWDKEPTQILDSSNPPFYRWFKGGKLNVCYNLVDQACGRWFWRADCHYLPQ